MPRRKRLPETPEEQAVRKQQNQELRRQKRNQARRIKYHQKKAFNFLTQYQALCRRYGLIVSGRYPRVIVRPNVGPRPAESLDSHLVDLECNIERFEDFLLPGYL